MTILRDALGGPDGYGLIVTAEITNVYSDGTVTLDLGDDRTVDSCPVLAPYVPAVGGVVQAMRRDASSFLVLGAIVTSATTTVDVSRSWGIGYKVLAQPTGSAGGDTTGSLTKNAIATSSWRNNEGWSKYPSDPLQGAYSSTWGYYRGLYFYGAGAFDSLRGRHCTRARIYVVRDNHGGIAGPERQWLAPHAHATRPSGAPVFTAGAANAGSVAWSSGAYLDLPISMGQALMDGRAKGIGHLYLGTADYSIGVGVGRNSLSGRIILDWKV